ncbi:hypothetical protein C2R22_24355 (plasmid) [Salinigranum rubrum]|uniref:sulfopyruvate decarboxylase n=1 Tax=Salinigranum rubrum TaxID=755307 RepID=A0A2I8VRY3_9EURY|nr:thiamine pyrophosphate-binding protein [Salinigranum rubrum]AUV84662.1 hypothetical protein C2R22_24355 [Salinigranum rubrum]
MSWEEDAFHALKESEIDFIAYLPDTVLDGLLNRLIDDNEFQTVRVAREEEAVSLLSGVWLGGGRGALICQSSGLANCFNALGSHAIPAELPFLGIVTRRGAIGEHNRAQVAAGYGLPRMLNDLGVRNYQLENADAAKSETALAAETAFATKEPYVLFLERTLTGGKDD